MEEEGEVEESIIALEGTTALRDDEEATSACFVLIVSLSTLELLLETPLVVILDPPPSPEGLEEPWTSSDPEVVLPLVEANEEEEKDKEEDSRGGSLEESPAEAAFESWAGIDARGLGSWDEDGLTAGIVEELVF